jgi:hypothetical protein
VTVNEIHLKYWFSGLGLEFPYSKYEAQTNKQNLLFLSFLTHLYTRVMRRENPV